MPTRLGDTAHRASYRTKRTDQWQWTRSLWLHAAMLAGILVMVLPIVGFEGVANPDEGSAYAQAFQLRDHGSWFIPPDLPVVGAEEIAFPMEHATRTDEGFAPLLKHPAYPALLSVAARFDGRLGIALVGILGTVIAAATAALIARDIRPRLTLWTLWVTGIASPLFFNSFVTIAHTLAAAGIGVAGVGMVRYLRRGSRLALLNFTLGIVWACSLRAEAVLFGTALTLTFVAASALHQRIAPLPKRRSLVLATVSGAASLLTWLIDRLAVRAIAPNPLPVNSSGIAGFGLVEGRLNAVNRNWILVEFNSRQAEVIGPIVVALTALTLGLLLRRSASDRGVWLIIVGSAWFGTLAWVTISRSLVPGIFPAFPLMLVGMGAWTRKRWRDPNIPCLATTAGIFALLVLATEYPIAGAIEWGARYLALGIPFLAPVLVDSIDFRFRVLDPPLRRIAAIALVPVALAPAAAGVVVVRDARHTWASVGRQISERVVRLDPGDIEKRIVVTDDVTLSRWVWGERQDGSWFTAAPDDIDELFRKLSRSGTNEFLFVTRGPARAQVPGYTMTHCGPVHVGHIDFNACLGVRSDQE